MGSTSLPVARRWVAAVALAVLVGVPASAWAQKAQARVVYHGASVRAKVPTLGAGWFYGSYAHARIAQGDCEGVALQIPRSKEPIMVMVSGLAVLQVDKRTNVGMVVIGLEPPADSDWQVVDLKSLSKGDSNCPDRT
jgi:hypothetical protein